MPAPVIAREKGRDGRHHRLRLHRSRPYRSACTNSKQEHGIKADFLRVRALPFTKEVNDFVNKHDQVFVVEMNRDGQMNQILTIEYPQHAMTFKSVAFGDGMPASAKWIREGILAKYEGQEAEVSTKSACEEKRPAEGKK
ncbi:MAG: hypothetical protein M0C28_34380 [Candidatus Moduliflexus flocculans]|nr:hypothetical protein [Candidatus Moduliflexus flocculans]